MSARRVADSAIERLRLREAEAGGGGDCMFLSVACLIFQDEDTLRDFRTAANVQGPVRSHRDLLKPLRKIAADSMDACHGLIDLFTAQLADSTSTLMSCAGGQLNPCWQIDPDQTLTTHCIDTTDSGR